MNDDPYPCFTNVQRKAKFNRCTLLCGKEWIRIPSIIYSSMLFTVVLVILGEEIGGTHATPHLPIVLLANLPWLLFPVYIVYRMWRYPMPFTKASTAVGVTTQQTFTEPGTLGVEG